MDRFITDPKLVEPSPPRKDKVPASNFVDASRIPLVKREATLLKAQTTASHSPSVQIARSKIGCVDFVCMLPQKQLKQSKSTCPAIWKDSLFENHVSYTSVVAMRWKIYQRQDTLSATLHFTRRSFS